MQLKSNSKHTWSVLTFVNFLSPASLGRLMFLLSSFSDLWKSVMQQKCMCSHATFIVAARENCTLDINAHRWLLFDSWHTMDFIEWKYSKFGYRRSAHPEFLPNQSALIEILYSEATSQPSNRVTIFDHANFIDCLLLIIIIAISIFVGHSKINSNFDCSWNICMYDVIPASGRLSRKLSGKPI